MPLEKKRISTQNILIEGVQFPPQLFKAHAENNLVVFVGAGVSMGEPSSLPNFDKLAEKIAVGTCCKYDENMSPDHFLGSLLYSNQVDVHKRAADILTHSESKPNGFHKNICKLFENTSSLRIVTTNYDLLLEDIAFKLYPTYPPVVYSAPALPLGDNFNGIVHLHGDVNAPQNMILTDTDFGNAYLNQGFSRRFLLSLFQRYTVLFIGYSYDDIIINYLTRALPDLHGENRFILTGEDSPQKWQRLGITPICYQYGNYEQLYNAFGAFVERATRTRSKWNERFKSLCSCIPANDSEEYFEIIQVLDNDKLFPQFLKNIQGEEWAYFLDEHNLLANLFQEEASLNERDFVFMDWLLDQCVTDENNLLSALLTHPFSNIHPEFIEKFCSFICRHHTDLSANFIERWVTFFYTKISDTFLICDLVETVIEKELFHLGWKLFLKLLTPTYRIKENTDPKHRYGLNVSFTHIEKAFLTEMWNSYLVKNIHLFALFAIDTITEILTEIADVQNIWQPGSSLSDAALIDMNDLTTSHSDFIPLLDIFKQCFEFALETDPSKTCTWVKKNISNPSFYLKKCAIFFLTKTGFSIDEQVNLILTEVGLYTFGLKRDVFRFIATVLPKCNTNKKAHIFSVIDSYIREDAPKQAEYEKYNWYVWLYKNFPGDQTIRQKLEELQKRNPDFSERKHPEQEISFFLGEARSPLSIEELLHIDLIKEYDWLKTFDHDFKEETYRSSLLFTISQCSSQNIHWAISFMDVVIQHEDWDSDIFEHILKGLSNADLSQKQLQSIIERINRDNLIKNQIHPICRYTEKLLNNNTFTWDNSFINFIYTFSEKLWQYRQYDEREKTSDWVTQSLNSAKGIIPSIWMILLKKEIAVTNQNIIPPRYLTLFDGLVKDTENSHPEFICVLGQYFYFLYHLNNKWCADKLFSFFMSENPYFIPIWEGFMTTSLLTEKIGNEFEHSFLFAMEHIDLFSEESAECLTKFYTLEMIHYAKNPLKDFIPRLFCNKKDNLKIKFADSIQDYLIEANLTEKQKLWDAWLYQYWKDRLNYNIPKPFSDNEEKAMLSWLPHFDDLFPAAVDLYVQFQAFEIESLHYLLHLLNEKNFYTRFPTDTANLFIFLCKCKIKPYDISRIEGQARLLLPNLNETASDKLRNALLEIGIDLNEDQ